MLSKSGKLQCSRQVINTGETTHIFIVARNRPLGGLRRIYEDNINMNLWEIGCDDGRQTELT
jgi:hypothetical protein